MFLPIAFIGTSPNSVSFIYFSDGTTLHFLRLLTIYIPTMGDTWISSWEKKLTQKKEKNPYDRSVLLSVEGEGSPSQAQ